ncbi:MAG: chromosomal replication initiator protein DnaA [Acidobacteriota bacterium]
MNAWSRVLDALAQEIDAASFATWLEPMSYVGASGARMELRAPSWELKNRVEQHYKGRILEAVRRYTDFTDVVILCDQDVAYPAPAAVPISGRTPERCGLNMRYTFDNFVVGSCNQFAHAASVAVSKAPGRSYNPLFIYGGVGLGKTHLLSAIGNQIFSSHSDLNIIFLTAEGFMNELITSVTKNRLPEFRERIRSVDVLLIDDIQFIAGKDKTKEEFFFTFNHLHDRRKQIVISSDAAPKDIAGGTLEERIHSRFEWGLMADIRPPDIETKVAILKRKADLEGVSVADDIALFIASKIKSNIRELESALTRLAAYASLKGEEISMALAKEALRDIVSVEEKVITIELIQKIVADEYGVRTSDLKSRNNAHWISFPRQIAMYIAKQLTDSSLPEIGRAFGGKHHSTVIHSVDKIESLRATDGEFNRRINSIIARFR